MTLKLLELFSGIGSFGIAMTRLGIDYELVGYSEILETAIPVFNNIHNTSTEMNLGDVSKVESIDSEVDIITFGSPCQNFSRSGKGGGGERGSGTKSSLMWEAVRIIKLKKPKYVIWENVPDAINKKNMPNFKNYIDEMSDNGYNTYYKILNANELGCPQKRKRLFSVSIRKDIDNEKFEFKINKKEHRKLKDYLEKDVDEIYNVPDKEVDKLFLGESTDGYMIKNGTKLGYLIAHDYDGIDYGFAGSGTRRGRVQSEKCQTLLRSKSLGTVENGVFRYFTPLEHWRLQELPDELYHTAFHDLELTQDELYDVVGGAINQLHLKVVFESLMSCFKDDFNTYN